MRRIDPKTGLLAADDRKLYSIATRKRPQSPPPNPPGLPGNWQAIEAPFIVHHADYYYLFVSFDLCCRGIKSKLCAQFDMNFYPDEALIVHSFHTVVIDRRGRLAANLEGNGFTSEQLGDLVQTVMATPATQP